MTHGQTLALLFTATLAGACGTAQQVHADLLPRREALLTAMQQIVGCRVPMPPSLYTMPGSWID